jgi:3alpha(or 20beta)-hydroxysteroid dehydrogenase
MGSTRRRLDGKVALITGGAQGMGSGIVRQFVEAGARVAIADIAVADGEALAAELGDAATFVPLDVSDLEQWGRAVEAAESHLGPIGVLVNNAGIGASTFLETLDFADYERVMRVDLEGVLFGMRACLPSLRRAGRGSIVNISSLQGIEADIGLLAYVAAKFAVRGVTKAAAIELAQEGIRVNSIHPGLTRSRMTEGIPDHFMGRIPLRRPGAPDRYAEPEDIGGLALYLASDASSYVTGTEIVIDGGKSIRFPSVAADYSELVAQLTKEKNG